MRIGREISIVLALKLLALAALYVLFFGPGHHMSVTPHDTATRVLGDR
jgi:hypothetical protein